MSAIYFYRSGQQGLVKSMMKYFLFAYHSKYALLLVKEALAGLVIFQR